MKRRSFLSGLAAGASATLWPWPVRAQEGTPPKRLVVFWTEHGAVHDTWRIRPNGESGDYTLDLTTLAESDFSESLAPLWPVRDRIVVVDGLSMISAMVDVPGFAHDVGAIHSLTGAPIQSSTDGALSASEASLDQVVAATVRRPDRLGSLEFAVGGTGLYRPNFSGPGARVTAETDPERARERLFPALGSAAARQQESLALVRAEYARLATHATGDDWERLQQHAALIEDLSRVVTGMSAAECPDAPDLPADAAELSWSSFLTLTTAALRCDLTRVITLQFNTLRPEQCWVQGVSYAGADVHDVFAHSANTDEGSKQVMTRYTNTHATQFAELVAALDSLPEGNGTVLDNTLILWCCDVGTGWHGFEPWPVVLAGGLVDPGRYLRYAPQLPNPTRNPRPDSGPMVGPPHNQLLTSVAHRFGVPRSGTGLRRTETPEGHVLDLGGPLPRL